MESVERDLLQLTLEREVARAKAELAELKATVATELANAKVEIGKHAVDKMSQAYGDLRKGLGIALLGLASVLGVGYWVVKEDARKIIQTQIADWLSFEKKGAILKETLESERMRIVLDSLVVKLERAKAAENYRPQLDMSDAEVQRLVAYMLDPKTPVIDFNDGARVLGARYGFAFPFSEPKTDELLDKVFGSFRSDDARPRILLTNLKNYAPLARYAQALLKRDDLPDDLRLEAFRALQTPFLDSVFAKSYARTHLMSEKSLPIQRELAKRLADDPSAQGVLDAWLQSRYGSDDGSLDAIRLADDLAPRTNGAIYSWVESKDLAWTTRRMADLLVAGIAHGARLTVVDTARPGFELAFQARMSLGIHSPESLFRSDDRVLKAIADSAARASLPPETFVTSLTTNGAHGEIFAMRAELGAAWLEGAQSGRIDSSVAPGSVSLVRDPSDHAHPMHARFQTRDGRWMDEAILRYHDFFRATLHFAYDQTFLQMAQRRNAQDRFDE